MNRASLDHEVAALMGTLAAGGLRSGRATIMPEQLRFASRRLSCPVARAGLLAPPAPAALSLPASVLRFRRQWVSGTLPTLSQEETLS